MRWIKSADGTTIDGRGKPKAFYIKDVGTVGLSEQTDLAMLAFYGWYPLNETTRPPDSPTETWTQTIANDGPGVFNVVWSHDPAGHTARLQDEADEAADADRKTRFEAVASAARGRADHYDQQSVDGNWATSKATVAEMKEDFSKLLRAFADFVEHYGRNV